MASERRWIVVAIGVVGGLFSGLLGVGGGIVMVPGLVLLLAFPQHRAHATSLAAILPIGAVGAGVFGAGGKIELALAGWLALGAVVGAPLGVRLMAGAPEPLLRLTFVAVGLVAGVRLLVAS